MVGHHQVILLWVHEFESLHVDHLMCFSCLGTKFMTQSGAAGLPDIFDTENSLSEPNPKKSKGIPSFI